MKKKTHKKKRLKRFSHEYLPREKIQRPVAVGKSDQFGSH